jgi:hypothetical protein
MDLRSTQASSPRDANKQRSVPSKDWKPEEIKENAVRAVQGTSPLSMTRRSEPHRQ